MNKVSECFNILAEYAGKYRKIHDDVNLKFDGKNYWEQLKPQLADINSAIEFDTDNIKELYKELTDREAPEKDEHLAEQIGLDEYNFEGSMNEHHHFFIQLYRIPLFGAKTFTKLMQIGLNIGQLSPYIDTDKFAGKYQIFYHKNRMNVIDTYLKNIRFQNHDIEKIDNFINFMKEKDKEIMAKFDTDAQNIVDKLKVASGGSDNYLRKYKKYKAKYAYLKHLVK